MPLLLFCKQVYNFSLHYPPKLYEKSHFRSVSAVCCTYKTATRDFRYAFHGKRFINFLIKMSSGSCHSFEMYVSTANFRSITCSFTCFTLFCCPERVEWIILLALRLRKRKTMEKLSFYVKDGLGEGVSETEKLINYEEREAKKVNAEENCLVFWGCGWEMCAVTWHK